MKDKDEIDAIINQNATEIQSILAKIHSLPKMKLILLVRKMLKEHNDKNKKHDCHGKIKASVAFRPACWCLTDEQINQLSLNIDLRCDEMEQKFSKSQLEGMASQYCSFVIGVLDFFWKEDYDLESIVKYIQKNVCVMTF